jgi:hypothetical protein
VRPIVLLVLAVLMAIGTALLGWAAVPLLAALLAVLAPRLPGLAPGGRDAPGARAPAGRVAMLAALAGALAWGALLAVDATGARFAGVLRMLSGVMQLPGVALVATTLLLPALLAWAAAALVEGVVVQRAPSLADAAPFARAASATDEVRAHAPGTQLETRTAPSAGA